MQKCKMLSTFIQSISIIFLNMNWANRAFRHLNQCARKYISNIASFPHDKSFMSLYIFGNLILINTKITRPFIIR